jgi:hypothetical protein
MFDICFVLNIKFEFIAAGWGFHFSRREGDFLDSKSLNRGLSFLCCAPSKYESLYASIFHFLNRFAA